MKKTLLMVWLLLPCLLLSGCASYDFAGMTHFSFYYTTGNFSNAAVCYQLDLADGVYTVTVKKTGVPDENADVFTVDAAFAQRVEKCLTAYKAASWNGFDKNDKRVLDGNSFSLHIRNGAGQNFSASGYMRWPRNYSAVKNELDALFMQLYSPSENK